MVTDVVDAAVMLRLGDGEIVVDKVTVGEDVGKAVKVLLADVDTEGEYVADTEDDAV